MVMTEAESIVGQVERPTPDLPKTKIAPVRVPSDDCLLYTERVIKDGAIVEPGTGHAVHEGEALWVLPGGSVQLYLHLQRLTTLGAGGGEARSFVVAENALDELCEAIARRVAGWNWTDIVGEPLPQPFKNPGIIRRLSDDELVYLVNAITRETPGQRKNG